MSFERNSENAMEVNPALEKRIKTVLKKIAKQFSTDPEVIEDIVREYIQMRPLPPAKEMKEWEANFLQEKKDLIRREVAIDEVCVGCGVAAQAVMELILRPEFFEEYPFPPLSEKEDEWKNFLTAVCLERMEDLQNRTQGLIDELENPEE